LQLLPGAPDDLIDRLEANVQKAGTVSNLMKEGLDPEGIIRRVLGDMEVEILETTPITYKCYCSRHRVESTLISLGQKELQSIIDDGKPISVGCQFCDVEYTFTPQDIQNLLEEATS
jgi:molecular chaperone Hsp33